MTVKILVYRLTNPLLVLPDTYVCRYMFLTLVLPLREFVMGM